MKRYLIYCIFVLILFGCGKIHKETQPKGQSSVKVSESKNELNKEDILSAFRFWVNKKAWLYEDFEYVDIKKEVDVYYKKVNNNEYLGYLYISSENGYIEISFLLGKDGYRSEPFSKRDKKEVENGLTYLGKEIFYFANEDVSKPEFPASSEKKDKFIQKAKQKIQEVLLSTETNQKKSYQVYILDFTNEDVGADVIIIENNKEMNLCRVLNQIELDDGTVLKDIAEYMGGRGPVIDWSDSRNRKDFEKELQLAVCKFTIDAM